MRDANNPRGPQRLRIAASSMIILASLAGFAMAAEFDEKLKAPLMKDAGSMRTQAQSYSARFAALKEAGTEQLITNKALAGERFDLAWQLQQAIDVGRPLGDTSAIGLVNRGDGSYSIDLRAFPQWDRLDQQVAGILPQTNWDAFSQQLIARGMAPTETAKLKEYVDTHHVRTATGAQLLPLSLSFSKLVRKYDKLKQPVPESVVLSYVYQRARTSAEVTREWTDGLLKSVDSHSSRILLSTLAEGESSSIWAPSNQAGGVADILATVRLPNFEQLATAEAQGETP